MKGTMLGPMKSSEYIWLCEVNVIDALVGFFVEQSKENERQKCQSSCLKEDLPEFSPHTSISRRNEC